MFKRGGGQRSQNINELRHKKLTEPASTAPGVIKVASPQGTGCPWYIPDFPVNITITTYLTQSHKLLHANQPTTANDVNNIMS